MCAQLKQMSSIYLLRRRRYIHTWVNDGKRWVMNDLVVIPQTDPLPALITMASSH